MLGVSCPLALLGEHPLVGRTERWSPKRRKALDRTPPTGRLTVDTALTCISITRVEYAAGHTPKTLAFCE
jgi:hypothetical protein